MQFVMQLLIMNLIFKNTWWAEALKKVEQYEEGISLDITAANNLYAGFGLGTVNAHRNLRIQRIDNIECLVKAANLESTSYKTINYYCSSYIFY